MATKVASLFGVLSLDDKDFIRGIGVARSGILDVEGDLKNMGGGLGAAMQRLSGKITEIGGQMTVLSGAIDAVLGPVMDFGQAGVEAAVNFEESMKNAQAAAGYTGDEIAVISEQVLAIGEASRYGPQQAADAFYEIAGGVSDASVRMDIFKASVKAAQAGNAELAPTTKALIGLMNGYGLEASEAAFASDVLTRIVGTGVGSMDEFGAALASGAKFAANYGVGLEDLGSQLAYLTTKNIPAAQSATILNSMITTLLSPTKDLAAAIKEAGYTSGEAMIKAEGLTGAYAILKAENGGSLSGLITNTEALAGATLLATNEFQKFDDTFKGSTIVQSDGPKGLVDNMDLVSGAIQGATADAEAIQMSSTAAQFDLLTSSVDGLKIAVGDSLLPVLTDLTNNVLKPIVQGVKDWVAANPQAAQTIMLVTGAVGLLGIALGVAGGAITGIGIALGVLLSPIALAIAGAVLLAAAYFTNFGGLKDFVDGTVRPALEEFFNLLRDAWGVIQPELQKLYDWFVTSGLPEIQRVVGEAYTSLETIFNFLQGVWDQVKPTLTRLFDWFTTGEGLLAIQAVLLDAQTWFSDASAKIIAFGNTWLPLMAAVGIGILLFTQSTYAVTAMGWAVAAAQAISAGATAIWGFMTGVVGLAGGAFSAAGIAAGGMGASMMMAIAPILAVGAAVLAVIAAINNFKAVTADGQGYAVGAVAGSPGLTKEQLWDQVAASAVAEYGPGMQADTAARYAYSQLEGSLTPAPKAAGGPVMGGVPYMVGEQGREIFLPETSGRIMNNSDTEGMMGGMTIGNINVYAETAAGGRAAADAFGARLREQLASK